MTLSQVDIAYLRYAIVVAGTSDARRKSIIPNVELRSMSPQLSPSSARLPVQRAWTRLGSRQNSPKRGLRKDREIRRREKVCCH